MMRGTPGMRLAMAVLSPLFFLVCVVAIHSEETKPWMRYQEQFNDLYVTKATAKLKEAAANKDDKERARWQRLVTEVSQAAPTVDQVYLDDLKRADRCTTCHRGISNALFTDAPQPFRSHPGKLLKSHDPSHFGCTLCHQGDGTATTVDAAHGKEANAEQPLLPIAYVQASCARCHEVTQGVKGAESVSHGANLFLEKGCYGCHEVSGVSYLPRFAPRLDGLKSKLRRPKDWIYAWVKDPRKLRPDTAMPDFKLNDEQAGAITAFLLTLPAGKMPPATSLGSASAEEGKRLFTERGCRGCHGVDKGEHGVSPRVPLLTTVGSKVTTAWLDAWVKDPKTINPDTAMPKLKVTDDERHAITAYLQNAKRAQPLPAAPDLSRFKAEEGKKLVKKFECYGCHAIPGFEKARPAVPNLREFARKSIDELDFGTTTDVPHTKWDWLARKVRDPRAYERSDIKLFMPSYGISDKDLRDLVAFVLSLDAPELPAHYVVRAGDSGRALRDATWMTAHLNCNGCHRLFGREPHIAQFLERKTMSGPTLADVGARLQGQYLYDFIMEPKQVRPWLKMRMPTFGFSANQARTLVTGFAAAARVNNPYTYVATKAPHDKHFNRGMRRFQHFKCMQCHPSSVDQGLPEGVDPDDLSINMMLAKERLRPEWIKDFLRRPKEIAGTATRMPTIFYTVDGTPKVEKPNEDINDITTYLMGMTEPPEVSLKAEEELKKKEKEKEDIDWTQYDY